MIGKIISSTPLYAWLLLALLLWKGLRARKLHRISWKDTLIFPAIMVVWSFYSTYNNYDVSAIIFWIVSFALGIGLGPLTLRNLRSVFDKKSKQIELSGSWIPLIILVSIFSLRYFLGVTYGMHPELRGTLSLLIVENLAAAISGIFLGRVLELWRRYKNASHVDLTAH